MIITSILGFVKTSLKVLIFAIWLDNISRLDVIRYKRLSNIGINIDNMHIGNKIVQDNLDSHAIVSYLIEE